MDINPLIIAATGLAIFVVSALDWRHSFQTNNSPVIRWPYQTCWAVALICAITAIALAFTVELTTTENASNWVLCLVTIFASVRAQIIVLTSAVGAKKPIQIGDRLPSFKLPDDTGKEFTSSSLNGHLTLIKVFRGHWCPYCIAELRRWKELEQEMSLLDIQIVTISTDKPKQISKARLRHNLNAIFLADPNLKVIDLLGLRNQKKPEIKPPWLSGLPVPTTLLIDAEGIVVWKDQARNTLDRSNPEIVRRAIKRVLIRANKQAEENLPKTALA